MDNQANYRDDPVFEGYVFPDDRDPGEPAEDVPAVEFLVDRNWVDDPRHRGNLPHVLPQIQTPPIELPVDPSVIVEPKQPRTFKDMFLEYSVRFNEYRVRGNKYRSLKQVVGAGDKDAWERYPYPRKGKVNPRHYKTKGIWAQVLSSDMQSLLNVSTPSLYDTATDKAARESYEWTREYFESMIGVRFETKKLLSYNDFHLLVRMDYRAEKDRKHRDFVLKLPSDGFESSAIRAEQRALRKVAGAAHCMQSVDVKELGIAPQKKYPFDEVDPWDTSSEESSAWESPADEAPPPPLTRRERIETELDAVEARIERHEKRCKERKKYLLKRRAMFDKLEEPDRLREDLPFPHVDAEWDLWHKDYIFFDFMENGDLEHLIYRLVETETDVPNRVLWSFWLCLIKSCISLEYPPRKFHPRRRERFGNFDGRQVTAGSPSTGKIVGNDLFEDIPVPSRRWAGKRFVHFEIDPTNILIGGLDPSPADGEHSMVPRLKLGDFGTMKKIKPNKGNAYYVSKRIAGKYGYYAPEQFGIDWDHVKLSRRHGPEISEQEVAGNYGSWTNIWGIALTMWMVITKLRPPLPPQRSEFNMLDVQEPVHYCPLLLDDPKFSKVDEELRRTIAECMRHAPNTRPTLVDLFEQAKKGVTRHFEGETDDFIRRWVQSLIFDATIPDAEEPDVEMPDVDMLDAEVDVSDTPESDADMLDAEVDISDTSESDDEVVERSRARPNPLARRLRKIAKRSGRSI